MLSLKKMHLKQMPKIFGIDPRDDLLGVNGTDAGGTLDMTPNLLTKRLQEFK